MHTQYKSKKCDTKVAKTAAARQSTVYYFNNVIYSSYKSSKENAFGDTLSRLPVPVRSIQKRKNRYMFFLASNQRP